MALFSIFLFGVVGYALYNNMGGESTIDPGTISTRVKKFKNEYFPVEADISDHILRNTPFGFIPGRHPGKLEYANKAKPLIDKGEFYDRLNESQWGYAAGLDSPAINTNGYQALINDQFNIQEHPRLDITLQDPSKGRHRRRQYAFVGGDD